jgi:hypothetical protein
MSGPDQAEISRLGLAPTDTRESALLATLAAGNYTAIVSGVSATTGVGVVEYYALADISYPRIFQAWGNATNLNEPETTTVARHDLMWNVESGFGWNWVNSSGVIDGNYHDEIFTQTNSAPEYPIPTLRSLNHNIKVLCDIKHYAVPGDALPITDPWWKLDANGNRIPGGTAGNFLLNEDKVTLQDHVAARAAAAMSTGQFDGIFLDQCHPSTTFLLSLLTKVRNAIGANGLIVVNANDNELSISELGQINGVFMESSTITTVAGWNTARDALDFNELHTRTPRYNCFEDAWINSRNDLNLTRATTCLSLTHSNGLALFDDPNYLTTQDHLHNWYDPFWSNHNLGVPTGIMYKYPNATSGPADRRDFKNGSAIWNKSGNATITVTLPEMRTSLATGVRATTFTLPGNDGGIYIY